MLPSLIACAQAGPPDLARPSPAPADAMSTPTAARKCRQVVVRWLRVGQPAPRRIPDPQTAEASIDLRLHPLDIVRRNEPTSDPPRRRHWRRWFPICALAHDRISACSLVYGCGKRRGFRRGLVVGGRSSESRPEVRHTARRTFSASAAPGSSPPPSLPYASRRRAPSRIHRQRRRTG